MAWTVGATPGISTASWFGSYQGIGPRWVNQNVTINGKYYAAATAPILPAANGDA
ncbi:hypothetical protein [Arthrobacter sp. 24S4-2]|uniref:hypothetical protein n=1 Tax=Arthrobacter sp. 24S4-2 TaxID=2575374 RepID=UPI001586CD9A|nr:hypothetical protein [Arthrobacter sp. 24S4-2]